MVKPYRLPATKRTANDSIDDIHVVSTATVTVQRQRPTTYQQEVRPLIRHQNEQIAEVLIEHKITHAQS